MKFIYALILLLLFVSASPKYIDSDSNEIDLYGSEMARMSHLELKRGELN